MRELLHEWFDGLNRGDLAVLLRLFNPSPRIRNAASPALQGPDAARRLLEDFFDRTSSRHFELIDWATCDSQLFASWTAELMFRAGVTIGGILLPKPMAAPLRGVDRFVLDPDRRIVELHIVHETTSLPLRAVQLTKGVLQ